MVEKSVIWFTTLCTPIVVHWNLAKICQNFLTVEFSFFFKLIMPSKFEIYILLTVFFPQYYTVYLTTDGSGKSTIATPLIPYSHVHQDCLWKVAVIYKSATFAMHPWRLTDFEFYFCKLNFIKECNIKKDCLYSALITFLVSTYSNSKSYVLSKKSKQKYKKTSFDYYIIILFT